ncbi:MAG: aminotransferase class V-fold PLP-dependent enzyme [Thermoleophilaceae bacterium]|nr:aminotransferase class V-fold PLP-dependent enzyme [Thermoleophilaceae bacterium]
MPDLAAFRSEFPVLERKAYLNAGSNGPAPRRGIEAAQARLDSELEIGRGTPAHWEGIDAIRDPLRATLAALLRTTTDRLAITGSTTHGMNAVLQGLALGAGDELLTTTEEHPGLLAPLHAARQRTGASIRTGPFGEIAHHIRPETKLVACSHVSWVNGAVVDTDALAAAAPAVLLDGAQSAGAVDVAVESLGCDFYAAAGQKWLCGSEGTGLLWLRDPEALRADWTSYSSLADASDPTTMKPGAARFDTYSIPGPALAWSHAGAELFAATGWDWVHTRGPELAAGLADELSANGRTVAPRGDTTLVAWESGDPEAESKRLEAEGIVVRHLPGTPYVRASVGAWSSESELERLVSLS